MSDKPRIPSRTGADSFKLVTALKPSDRLMVITDEGVRALPRGDALKLFAGGGGSGSVSWDVAADEKVYPFSVLPMSDTTETEEDGLSVKLKSGAKQGEYHSAGALPRSGNYWMSVTFDTSDVSSDHVLGVVRSIADSDTRDVFATVFASHDEIILVPSPGKAVVIALKSAMSHTVLFNFDIDANCLTVYTDDGHASISPRQALAGCYLAGTLTSDVPGDSISFNITDRSDSPVEINGAWVAQELIYATRPDDVLSGAVVFATSTGATLTQQLEAGGSYYVADESYIEFVSPATLARLKEDNSFERPIGQNDYVLESHAEVAYFGPKRVPIVARLAAAPASLVNFGRGFAKVLDNGNVGFGVNFNKIEHGWNNVGVGITGDSIKGLAYGNTFLGTDVGSTLSSATDSVLIGHQLALGSDMTLNGVVAIGRGILNSMGNEPCTLTGVTVVGDRAYQGGRPGNYVTIQGSRAGASGPEGNGGYYTLFGAEAMRDGNGERNHIVAVGYQAAYRFQMGSQNVAVGDYALNIPAGVNMTAVGHRALYSPRAALCSSLTALGADTMRGVTGQHGSTAVGAGSTTLDSRQIQLGTFEETVHSQHSLYARRDGRDMADVSPTRLGLEFILALKPVDFRTDSREAYVDYDTMPVHPGTFRDRPLPLLYGQELNNTDYAKDLAEWQVEKDVYDAELVAYPDKLRAWLDANRLSNVKPDGSYKSDTVHHGFDAADVRAKAKAMGYEFGGVMEVSSDVLGFAETELIGPIVVAMQELNKHVHSEALVTQVAQRVLSGANLDRIASRVADFIQNGQKKK